MNAFLRVLLRLVAGFAVGCVVNEIQMNASIYLTKSNSQLSHPSSAINFNYGNLLISSILSALFVLIAWGFGSILLLQPFRRWWNQVGILALVPTLIGASAIIFSEQLGLTTSILDGDTATVSHHEMNAVVWVLYYLLTIFPIVNWPRKTSP